MGRRSGPWRLGFADGRVQAEGTFVDGLLEGWWVEYWDSGGMKSEGEYRTGLRQGPWNFRHQDGSADAGRSGLYVDGERRAEKGSGGGGGRRAARRGRA